MKEKKIRDLDTRRRWGVQSQFNHILFLLFFFYQSGIFLQTNGQQGIVHPQTPPSFRVTPSFMIQQLSESGFEVRPTDPVF
jgi:hypothetical protein